MNKVFLTGHLVVAPDKRVLAGGRIVTQFMMVATDDAGETQYVPVVTWDELAETCGAHLAKNSKVFVEGRLQVRAWDDDQRVRHSKAEVVASYVEPLGGRAVRFFAERGQPASPALATDHE